MQPDSRLFSAFSVPLLVLAVSSANGAQVLEEVVVTATKRAQSVQDVPISVAVVSGEFMDTFDIEDPTDLQNFVPGFQVQETFGSVAVRVRGLGSGITNLAFDSSVPLYIDEVYSGRGNALLAASMDMDQMEVARGPQGALFGKSTIAGAINAATARPTDEFEAELRIGSELEEGGYKASAVVSGPFSDSLRGRIALMTKDFDGWVRNIATGEDDNSEEMQVARVSLEWDSGDNTSWFFKYETGDKDIDGRSNQLVAPGLMSLSTSDPNAEYRPDTTRSVSTGFGEEDFTEMDWDLATLSVDTELMNHQVKVILGKWDYEAVHFLDVDGHPEDILTTHITDDYESASLEVRILSQTGGNVEYILGAWYQDSELNNAQFSKFAPLFWQAAIGLPVAVGSNAPPLADAFRYGTGGLREMTRDAEAYSIYGQLTWNITDRLSAIIDVRYTDEDQDAVGQTRNLTWNTGDNFNPSIVPRGFPGHNQAYLFRQKRNDDSLDPSARLTFDVTDDIMIYGAYASGSKAGGMKANDGSLGNQLAAADADFLQRYVGVSALTPAEIESGLTLRSGNGIFDFEDEEADSYELGFKMTLFEGAATLNGTLFETEFKNLQTSNYDGTNFIIGNAGQATVDGFELEFNWQASGNLRLQAAGSWIDATYDDFEGAQCVLRADGSFRNSDCVGTGNAARENQEGERLERSPEEEYNLSALWESPISDRLMMKLAASVYYSGDYFVQPTQDPTFAVQDSHTKYDLRLAIAGIDDNWEVAVNGRNLGDERVIQHAYNIAGNKFQALTRGRTVTVDLMVRF